MLKALQQILQRLYAVDVGYDITDFVITDAALVSRLGGHETADVPEKLLIHQDGDNVDVSLYLEPDLVARLEQDDPFKWLHAHNISEFCVALEGVSHFLYLAWNAASDRRITLLELEIQAEVDKYATLAILLKAQRGSSLPGWLRRWLFEKVSFLPTLSRQQLERYCHANHFAGRYCRHLERRFCWRWNGKDLVKELRQFYRFGQGQKINYINHVCV